jgi:hypothetical protein
MSDSAGQVEREHQVVIDGPEESEVAASLGWLLAPANGQSLPVAEPSFHPAAPRWWGRADDQRPPWDQGRLDLVTLYLLKNHHRGSEKQASIRLLVSGPIRGSYPLSQRQAR